MRERERERESCYKVRERQRVSDSVRASLFFFFLGETWRCIGPTDSEQFQKLLDIASHKFFNSHAIFLQERGAHSAW